MPDPTAYPEVTDWLGEEIARLKNQIRQANAEVQHLERRVKTQDATIGRMSNEIERLRAKHQAELASLQAHADRFREKDWAHSAEQAKRREQAEAERDEAVVKAEAHFTTYLEEVAKRGALQAAIEKVKAEHTDDGTGACETCSNEDPTGLHDYREPMPCPTLRALGYPEKGAESHGGGRTPQTQGASEAREANEAQEASQ